MTQPRKGEVGVGGDCRANIRRKFDGSKIGVDEIDSNEDKDNEVGKNGQKTS